MYIKKVGNIYKRDRRKEMETVWYLIGIGAVLALMVCLFLGV